MRLVAVVLCGLAPLSCARRPVAVPVVVAREVDASAPASDATAGMSDGMSDGMSGGMSDGAAEGPCARARATTDAANRSLPPVPEDSRESDVETRAWLLRDDGPYRFCHATARGTWSVEVESLRRWRESPEDPPGPFLEGRWALVFTAPDGTRAVAHPTPDARTRHVAHDGNLLAVAGLVGIYPERFVPFDYDGDGVPELVSVVETNQHEAPRLHRAQVWTARDGRVVPYAPADAIAAVDVDDADADGRPDLVTHLGYESLSTGRGSYFEYLMTGPRFIAHATADGRFATADPGALAAARRICAPAAGSVVRWREGMTTPSVDDYETAGAIVCARMRGAQPASVVSAVRRACAPRRGEEEDRCDSVELFEAWARRPPPLRL